MLTQERVRDLLNYDPETGIFTWRRRQGQCGAGAIAGSNDGDGYRRVKVDRRSYRAARLAWFYVTGSWPPVQIDHADTDSMNDRWSNLRLATASQNRANTCRPVTNSSGIKGVSRHRSKWGARIQKRWLGTFDSPEKARAAYAAAAAATYGEFGRPA